MEKAVILRVAGGLFFGMFIVCAGNAQTAESTATAPAPKVIAAHSPHPPNVSNGDARQGRKAFTDLQCHACHRVAEDMKLPVFEGAWDGPLLHGLGKEPAEAVAWKIVSRSSQGPESIYESPMAERASAMTEKQLVDLIAYLRDPAAGAKEDVRPPKK